MNPNDIFNMAASIGRAQVASAQAAHDARQPEVDRLKSLNAELVKALRDGAAYLEAQRCWLKSDANPAVRGRPLHERESAAEQVNAELARMYAAIASAERAGR